MSYPIELNAQQNETVRLWAADSAHDLWGNNEAREFNLRVFARDILATKNHEEFNQPFLLGVEFGYKQGEKGANLQMALIEANNLIQKESRHA